MFLRLLTEHRLEFLGLTGNYTGSSESTLVKMPHCWKSHVTAHLFCTFQVRSIEKEKVTEKVVNSYVLVEFLQQKLASNKM